MVDTIIHHHLRNWRMVDTIIHRHLRNWRMVDTIIHPDLRNWRMVNTIIHPWLFITSFSNTWDKFMHLDSRVYTYHLILILEYHPLSCPHKTCNSAVNIKWFAFSNRFSHVQIHAIYDHRKNAWCMQGTDMIWIYTICIRWLIIL